MPTDFLFCLIEIYFATGCNPTGPTELYCTRESFPNVLRPGPEDVLQFPSMNLPLKPKDTVDLPLTYNYRPAIHHPQRVQWVSYRVPVEPDQFADAD